MKTRLPKMLLAAVLAAMTSAYADMRTENGHQYYFGGGFGDPIVIDNAADFGSGISGATEFSTVSIGYGDKSKSYDGVFTLTGDSFATPNALFIGGPGGNHTISEGYKAGAGRLGVDNATLTVASNILMGTCAGVESVFGIDNNGAVYAVNMQVSNGGGWADAYVRNSSLDLTGNLAIGTNNVTGLDYMAGGFSVQDGGLVNVAGATSVGYDGVDAKGNYFCGGTGMLEVNEGGTLNTGSLEMGIGKVNEGVYSRGAVYVSGSLNVTGLEIEPGVWQETIIGMNGASAILDVMNGGTVDLGQANVRLGSAIDEAHSEPADLVVENGGRLYHDGTIYVGDKGTVSQETGDPNYGIGYLQIEEGATAELNRVEVSEDSRICVDGKLTVDETPDADGLQGVRLYRGAILAGTPDNQGGNNLTFSVVPERGASGEHLRTDIVIDNFNLTAGTTLKTCCDAHLLVGQYSSLTFGEGTLWLTDNIIYIDSVSADSVGTITTTAGTGNISVAGNDELNGWLNIMGSQKQGSPHKVALIDTDDFISAGGNYDNVLSDGTLKLDRAGFEVRFTDEAVTTLNTGEGFRGFYVVKTSYPSEEAYPTFDRNQREVYDHIKQLDEEGTPMPDDLREVITDVLNTDGVKEGDKLRETLDFLGAVNYSVMMHNQIEGNLSHQRLLRNRSTVGRNLRHGKGCTDLYAAGFFDNQRVKYSRAKGEGYRRSEWGGIIGGDTCINENLRLGADVALGWSNISPTHNMKLKQSSVYWDVYAQYRKGNWRSLTAVGMGIHNFKVERGIHNSILHATAKKNSVRGLSLNISEEVTYDWKVNEKTTIQPFAAVDMSWNRISSFTDGDIGALNMHVAKQTAFIAEFTVGGRYIRDFACVTDAPDATWYFQLGVAVAAGDVDSDMDCNFQGTPDKHFTIKAADRDRVGLDLGTGLTVPVNAAWAIYGNAEIIVRGDSHHLNAQVGAQYAF